MADTGLKSPTTTGSPLNEWANPSNAFASDNVYATVGIVNKRQDYATFTFGVPTGVTINGILVNVEMKSSATVLINGESATLAVDLSWDGGTTYTAAKSQVVLDADPEQVYALGGATDTWGRTWAVEDFSDTNFRLRIKDTDVARANFNPGVDQIQVQVFYAGGGSKSFRLALLGVG